MDFREEDIYWALGEFALQFDGYCAADVVPYSDDVRNHFFEDFRKYFYIPKDKLLIRTQLFMLQRWFGKWGGEQTPEYDRDYSLYYLLFLEVYRYHHPVIFDSDWGYHKYFPRKADDATLENLAGAIRHCFAGEAKSSIDSLDYVVSTFFTPSLYGFLTDQKLLSRPEVLLAASINPILVTKLSLRKSSDDISNIHEDLSFGERKNADQQFGRELTAIIKSFKFSQDDIRNHLYLFILQAWLARNPISIDSFSAEYILFMFLYLHLYRAELPEFLGREPFYSSWKALPKSRKEDTAEDFRKKLCLLREVQIKQKQLKQGEK